jgi:amino acid transporter
MKSFRLVSESHSNWLISILIFVGVGLLLVVAMNLGVLDDTLRISFMLFLLVFMCLIATGRVRDRLAKKYPDANSLWLLVIGATASVFGVCIRVVFLENRTTVWDSVWLSVVFFSLLFFVLKNRDRTKETTAREIKEDGGSYGKTIQ